MFATLRGPLFAVSDAALLAYRAHCRTLHPFRALPADLPMLMRIAELPSRYRRHFLGR